MLKNPVRVKFVPNSMSGDIVSAGYGTFTITLKEKGALISYDSLDLQDYLNSCSNLTIDEQRFIFSIRSEINPLKQGALRECTPFFQE